MPKFHSLNPFNSLTSLTLGILLFIGITLRLYHFWDGYGFFGDQGRDLLEVLNWLNTGSIPLVGPITSAGDFHLGPLFYYLITPTTILSNFNSIGPVIFNLICGLLLIIATYFFLKKFIDFSAAFTGAFLVTTSPHLIFLSRGSWNPNPEPLFVVLLLYCLVNLLQSEKIRFAFLSFMIIGLGIQLHYTFGVNLFAAIILILLFKPRILLNFKFYPAALIGILLPFLPFLIGQFQNNFIDIHYLREYLNTSSSQPKIILVSTIVDRFMFPMDIFYPRDIFPYYLSWILKILIIILMMGLSLLAVSKHNLSKLVKILLIYFMTCGVITGYLAIPFKWWYYQSFSIVIILLISIFISYVYQNNKLKFLWLGIFGIFAWWQIYMIPETYQVSRSPQSVQESAQVIIEDLEKSPILDIGILAISPVTLKEAYEYRFFIEKNGYKTHSISDIRNAHYIIFESADNTEVPTNILQDYNELANLAFNNFGNQIKYAKVYKRIN